MIYVIMVIRDSKADVFGRPYFVGSVGVGVRSFADEVNRVSEDNVLYQHCDDFSLWTIGKYDDSDGRIEVEVPRMVILGSEVRKDVPYVS